MADEVTRYERRGPAAWITLASPETRNALSTALVAELGAHLSAAIEDPAVRARLAEIECYVRACETTNLRMLSASARGEELSVMLPMMMIKLFSTEVMKQIACAAYDLLGSDGLLEPFAQNDSIYDTSATKRGVVHNYMYSLGPAIAGGTSNIQRNIIGERGLGLPRDLRPER